MTSEIKVTKQLTVREFFSNDSHFNQLAKGIQAFLQSPHVGYEGELASAIKEMGVDIVKWPGCNIEFPSYLARAWGHSGGVIDIYAQSSSKRAGIEYEEHSWYKACIPEILKLGWSDFDYRIIAWEARRVETMKKLATIEMLPFPHPVLVISRCKMMEVSSGR